jgi:hypothetical protein
MGRAFVTPPENPEQCLFAKMSTNYSADLTTRVEPCVFGGTPDCSQCGCSISSALHWVRSISVAGPLRIDHLVRASVKVGSMVNSLRSEPDQPTRWNGPSPKSASTLVQIES